MRPARAPVLPGARYASRRENGKRTRIIVAFLIIVLIGLVGYYHVGSHDAHSTFIRSRQAHRAHPEQRMDHVETGKEKPGHRPTAKSAGNGSGHTMKKQTDAHAFVHREKSWQGWEKMTHMFVFGDSHLETGFRDNGDEPSRRNPIGNPAFPGRTWSYGPNWVGHLTATHNQSVLLTWNFAQNGATLEQKSDDDLFHSSFPQQINKYLVARFGNSGESRQPREDWKTETSLFVFQMGTDELAATIVEEDGKLAPEAREQLVAAYIAGIQRMYEYGARNILVSNVPAIDQSPMMRLASMNNSMIRAGNICVDFNARLAFALHQLARALPDANVWLFDAQRMTIRVRANPQLHKETAGYVYVEGFCYLYADEWNLRDSIDTDQEACKTPLDTYYWRDSIHMQENVHRLQSRLMVAMMAERHSMLPYEDW